MSKLILFDFKCTKCARAFEELVKPGDYWAPCPECGGNAQRQLCAPTIDYKSLALSEGATPTSIAKFDRVHQQRKRIEDRTFANHGDYGKAPGSD